MKCIFPVLLLSLFTICVRAADSTGANLWTVELEEAGALPSGICRIRDARGNLMLEGKLKTGKMDGPWAAYTSTGVRILEIAYKDGVRQGPVRMWYGPFARTDSAGHIKLTGSFVDGRYDGLVVRLYPSGKKESEREYGPQGLVRARYWKENGAEESAPKAQSLAKEDLARDEEFLNHLEATVPMALQKAKRKLLEKSAGQTAPSHPVPAAP